MRATLSQEQYITRWNAVFSLHSSVFGWQKFNGIQHNRAKNICSPWKQIWIYFAVISEKSREFPLNKPEFVESYDRKRKTEALQWNWKEYAKSTLQFNWNIRWLLHELRTHLWQSKQKCTKVKDNLSLSFRFVYLFYSTLSFELSSFFWGNFFASKSLRTFCVYTNCTYIIKLSMVFHKYIKCVEIEKISFSIFLCFW